MSTGPDEAKVADTIAFALQMLGGELVEGDAPEGSMLWHMERLGALADAGEMTEEEVHSELLRLEAELSLALQPPLLTAVDLPASGGEHGPHAHELPDVEAVSLDPVLPEAPEDEDDGE